MSIAIAKIHGELITEVPSDLYIPPQALSIFLQAFEGPLDLLLYLIRKHSLDILDIPMAELTRQYMVYVDSMVATQRDLAAEYLLMASFLTEIKSRLLLPRLPKELEEFEEDPRAELINRLLEYECIKQAAQNLDALPQAERDFIVITVPLTFEETLPLVTPEDLKNAWKTMLKRQKISVAHQIIGESLSVRTHMSDILKKLSINPFLSFNIFCSLEHGKSKCIVHFLSILELARQSCIEIVQTTPFAAIYLRKIYNIQKDRISKVDVSSSKRDLFEQDADIIGVSNNELYTENKSWI